MSSIAASNTAGGGSNSIRRYTVADGISRTDDGYKSRSQNDPNSSSVSWADTSIVGSGLVADSDATLMSSSTTQSAKTILKKSHEGEWHGDHGDTPVRMKWRTYLYVACAALNSCQMGYDMGATTAAAPKIQSDFGLTNVQLELFVGSLNFCAIFGSLCSHFVSDRCGRRAAFIVAAVGFVAGIVIMISSQQYGILMLGRVFVGLGVGFALALDPVYISEISPAAHRGELVTWSEIGINIGIVLGFMSDLFFNGENDGKAWRGMFAVGLIMPMLLIFLVCIVMPESPRWLVSKDRSDDALNVLRKVYPEDYEVLGVLEDIRLNVRRDLVADRQFGWDLIFYPTPAVKRMLIVGVGVAICQQAVGIDAIQYFLVYILDQSGVDSDTKKAWILSGLGLVKLFFVIVASRLFDTKGRRPLMFLSCAGMIVALTFLSMNFYFTPNTWFAVFSLALYLAAFSLGMGPGAWLIPAEVFPTGIRAKAMSVATFMNRVTATVMSSTFLSTANAMSWAGFFSLLTLVVIIVATFLYIYLPETNGHSLEDMTVFFAEITGDREILRYEMEVATMAERSSSVSTPQPYSLTASSSISDSRRYRSFRGSTSTGGRDSSSVVAASTVGQIV